MDTQDILQKLRELKPQFKDMNIKRLALYGSRARGHERADSDVDLLIEFIDTPGFFSYFDTRDILEHEIGLPVDLTTFHTAEHKKHLNYVLNEAVDV